MKFGPCKLIWHHTNKQAVLEFMPDLTELILDVENGGLPTPDEKGIELSPAAGSATMRLECRFNNPDYAKEIRKRLIKQLSKGKKAPPLLLIPNYGFASKKDSMEFHHALPIVGSAIDDDIQKIIFLILSTR